MRENSKQLRVVVLSGISVGCPGSIDVTAAADRENVCSGARCKSKTGRHNQEMGDRSRHATASSHEKINKANSMLGLIKRNFIHVTTDAFLQLYKILVRSHLEIRVCQLYMESL